MNKGINLSIDEILKRGTTPLDAQDFKALSEQKDVMILDTRSKTAYAEEGTIPGGEVDWN